MRSTEGGILRHSLTLCPLQAHRPDSRRFHRMGKPLVVIGEGPESKQVQCLAGSNVKLLGYQPDEVVTHYLQQARAFVFAADEDFGIIPIEAQAAGCPVIAFNKGGALETVVGRPAPEATGVLYDDQTRRP